MSEMTAIRMVSFPYTLKQISAENQENNAASCFVIEVYRGFSYILSGHHSRYLSLPLQ